MSSDETIEFVTNYLTNFFSESTEDEIKSVLLETNPAILQVIATLVDHENSFREILEGTTSRIEDLEREIAEKDAQPTLEQAQKILVKNESDETHTFDSQFRDGDLNLVGKLHLLRSATYNAKLYLICEEIMRQYLINFKALSLKNVHREFGLNRIITSFIKDTDPSKKTGIASLLQELFTIEEQDGDYFIKPTALGIEIYKLAQSYYSLTEIKSRFLEMHRKNKLSSSKIGLMSEIGNKRRVIRNTSEDKKHLSDICGVHKDNISKYLVELVKLGFLQRIPNEYSNNLFSYQIFDPELLEP